MLVSHCEVKCGKQGQGCRIVIVAPRGLVGLEEDLEKVVEEHGLSCNLTLSFTTSMQECLLAICDSCDFLHSVGGF